MEGENLKEVSGRNAGYVRLVVLVLCNVSILFGTSFSVAQARKSPAAAVLTATAESHGLRSGPMVGYAEMTEVALWVQSTRPAQVRFRYWPEGENDPAQAAYTPGMQTRAEDDCIAQVLLTQLQSGRHYNYELYIDGRLVPRPYRLAFQTQPHWQWRTDPPAFTVAIGSCAYINEAEFDRPGQPYGGDYDIFRAMAAKRPDIMLWLGDNIYYREPEFYSATQMRRRYAHDRALPEWQALLGATHHYAIWDDHDYGPNNSDWTYRMKREALRAFKLYWANPGYGIDEAPGVFSNFIWGDVEFFMLDNRYYRTPNDVPDSPEKVMFGKLQMRWLKDALLSSNAPFRVIVAGNQMLNPLTFYEAFGNYKHEQTELLQWIKHNKVGGVLFLSGDRHHTELIRLEDKDSYPLYDYTSSPLTSGTHPPGQEAENPARVPGTLVAEKRNFGMLRFEGARTDRKLTMECYDKDGKLLWSHEVRANDLRVE